MDQRPILVKLPDGQTIDSSKTKLGAIVAKGAFFGVNCSIMPGVTIGEKAKVYPGKVLSHSLSDNETIK